MIALLSANVKTYEGEIKALEGLIADADKAKKEKANLKLYKKHLGYNKELKKVAEMNLRRTIKKIKELEKA